MTRALLAALWLVPPAWSSPTEPPASQAKAEAELLAGMCSTNGVDASRAIETLDGLPQVSPATEEAVVAALRTRSPWCQAWASVALGRIHPLRAAPALPILQQALKDTSAMLPFEAAITLGRMGAVARPALGALEALTRSDDKDLREVASSAAARIRERAFLKRPLAGLRLMALGRRESRAVAYLIDEDGFVFEMAGGEALLDGRIASVTSEAVDFEGERVTADFEVVPHRARLVLFEKGAPAAIPVNGENTGEPVSIDFSGDVGSFAAFVAEYAPLNVIVDAGRPAVVRAAARNAPWDAVVEHALRQAGVGRRIDGYYLRLGAPDDLDRHPRLPSRKYEGALVTLKFRGVQMAELVRVFESVSGVTIEIPPGAHEPLTLYFTDVPWDEAFEMVAATRGWTTRREGKRLVATPAS
ncbi:MAG TPA: hypothetical protein VFQ51_16970 [Vicinamibacteria bacterium]|nr:hypothetical protein [Vicinamibacteria bacterium]